MKWFEIGGDPVLWTYTWLVAVLLGVAGSVLLILQYGFKKPMRSVWDTYRGWLFIVPIVFGALWLGRPATIVGLAIISTIAFKEFARATGIYSDWLYTLAVYVGIISTMLLTLAQDPRTGELGWYGLFMATPVYFVALLLTIPILMNKTKGQLQRVSLSMLGFIYLGWMFAHLGFLTNSGNFYGYILYLFFAVELNDIAAFMFGKLFGKHKLRSEVSPNKTIEGALGAIVVSMAMPLLFHFSFPHFGTLELILTGLIVGVGGQLGDLSISFIKRDVGVKDMGASIPGHGGILDRVDSLIFVAPLFFHMVRWFHGVH